MALARIPRSDGQGARLGAAGLAADVKALLKKCPRLAVTVLTDGLEHVRVADERPVHDAITYLENHTERLDYAGARRKGLPIGSGHVEATCKSLVGLRMKRPVARWKEDTGQHVLDLRAHVLSKRWDRAMALTLEPLRRPVALAE